VRRFSSEESAILREAGSPPQAAPGDLGLHSYGEALWWTAMVITTMGSGYFPKTAEGRVLCLALAVFALAVFGYITATPAAFCSGRDADNEHAELAGAAQRGALAYILTEQTPLTRGCTAFADTSMYYRARYTKRPTSRETAIGLS
jgi:hypothetical protein